MINIVLVEPQIPQNTGNIARTCAATGSRLHLIKPFGFNITDTNLKRAGLDYWNDVDIFYYNNLEEFLSIRSECNLYFSTTKASRIYSDIKYPKEVYILFGKETKGLPEDLLKENYDRTIRIPMNSDIRSLNLSNSVAVITYEVLRQRGFETMQLYGKLMNS